MASGSRSGSPASEAGPPPVGTASAEAALPQGEAWPALPRLGKPGSISVHLGNFKRTGNPVSLLKAGSVAMRQGRLQEVLYGVRCFLTVRAAAVVAGGVPGEFFTPVLHEMSPPTTRSGRRVCAELRRQFPVTSAARSGHVHSHYRPCDDWMVVGEYADKSARMYFLNRHSCTPIPYYTKIEAVRHIHSVHRLSDTQVAVSTGDQAKLFDLWDIDTSGMRFPSG